MKRETEEARTTVENLGQAVAEQVEELGAEIAAGAEEVKEKVVYAIHELPAELRRIDGYKLSAYFLVCAFIGWVFETLAVWVIEGHLTDRGFLFIMEPLSQYLPFLSGVPVLGSVPLVWGLPIIMIYGVGGTAICSLFKRWKRHPVELFFIGMVVLTVLELISSYLCDWILHRSYWDYSNEFLNFDGRICIRSSLAWGALCVVGVKLVAPRIDWLYQWARAQRNFKVVITVLMLYAGVCAIVKYFLFPGIIPN